MILVMAEQPSWQRDVYRGLRSCLEYAFPKTCSCGRYYHTLADYLRDTEPLAHSHGLAEYPDDEGYPVVGVFRNCACKTTLLALCEDRRDVSERGQRRREEFDRLLGILVEKTGADPAEIRSELRKWMRGAPSRVSEWIRPDVWPPPAGWEKP